MSFVPVDKIAAIVPDVDGRNWVYPQKVAGPFTRARDWLGFGLIAIMAALPLIRIDDLPLILLDVPHRRFVIFGQVFWPQDTWLLFFLLFSFVIAILFLTALAGRAWCGYACPQTVFMHGVFLRIEQWLEGDRNAQMRLDRRPWGAKKVIVKLTKHLLFIAFASLVAHIFLSYFMDVRRLTYAIVHPSWDYKAPMIFAALVTLAFYIDFALLREQFCNYICPYARFQSALLDRDSLIVAYDHKRGEPRSKAAARADTYPAGDCVDCHKCVVVCPQGIDIREGLQLECIHCARCIDACDSVMSKIGKPKGLIRYGSDRSLRSPFGERAKTVRPRTVIYGAMLVVSLALFGWQVQTRELLDMTLLRPPGQLYNRLATGEIANHFRLSMVNKSKVEVEIQLELLDAPDWRLIVPENPVPVGAGRHRFVEVFVVAPQSATGENVPFTIFAVDDAENLSARVQGKAVLPQ